MDKLKVASELIRVARSLVAGPNLSMMRRLGITQKQISLARKQHASGEGVYVVGQTLGLGQHYDEREWDRVIANLGIFDVV